MTTESSPQVADTDGTPADDRRVGELIGNRVCLECGYNLIGQPIVRERHYNMVIARCPECATVVALQEYPRLGRWANRWAGMLAAALLLGGLGLLFTNGLIISISSGAFNYAAAGPYVQWLGEHQYDWMKTNDTANFEATYGAYPAFDPSQVYWYFDINWWNAQDPDALLAEAGGWSRVIDWRALWSLGWMAFWVAAFGVGWAGILLRFKRLRLLAFGGLILVVSYLLALVTSYQFFGFGFGTSMNIMGLATDQLRPYLLGACMIAAALPLALGLLLGRPLLRWLIRLLLHPRHVSALSILWICDGKAPPRPPRR